MASDLIDLAWREARQEIDAQDTLRGIAEARRNREIEADIESPNPFRMLRAYARMKLNL